MYVCRYNKCAICHIPRTLHHACTLCTYISFSIPSYITVTLTPYLVTSEMVTQLSAHHYTQLVTIIRTVLSRHNSISKQVVWVEMNTSHSLTTVGLQGSPKLGSGLAETYPYTHSHWCMQYL